MINTSKHGTLVYLHTLNAHIMDYLKMTGNWSHIYIKLSTSNRIYLSKFRCRSNYMPVSKVYKHADTYDTECKICDKNEIGDEFHYLFICPVFQEDRNRLLKEYYRKFPCRYKFIELMSTTNMKDLRKLAQFTTIILRKFQ